MFLACFKLRAAGINVNFRHVEDELRRLFDNADMVAVVHAPEFDSPFDGPTLCLGEAYEKALAAASPRPRVVPNCRSGERDPGLALPDDS